MIASNRITEDISEVLDKEYSHDFLVRIGDGFLTRNLRLHVQL